MKKTLKLTQNEFELKIGSVFMSVTAIMVIINVFTRYFLKFTFFWAEEIAVSCFVWVIFLGASDAYKNDKLIGVEILLKLVPPKGRVVVDFITSIIVMVIAGTMFYFSVLYVNDMTKITAALEVSYKYIYSSMVIAFALITIYSIIFAIRRFKDLVHKDYSEE